jgi:CheY-like chemotaxis protein
MYKVLVVEDDLSNREILTRFLRREGFEVILAGDGKSGLRAVSESRPDIVLMDLSLPELDGWEATRRLKSDPETASIPVIALTAHASTADVSQALNAGCDHYETKPVAYARLMKKIRTHLPD